MSLTVGLVYNLKKDCPYLDNGLVDEAAEYEAEETVEGIADAIRQVGCKVKLFPYRSDLFYRLDDTKPDLVFNIAEGWKGRNREALVPAILEFLGIPYTGSDPLTLSLCLDKAVAKKVVAASGINTPKFMLVEDLNEIDLAASDLSFPLFVKPDTEGSSKGIRGFSKVNNPEELKEKVAWVLEQYSQPCIIEEFLPGREFTVGLLGNGDPQVFPVMEICYGDGGTANERFVYSFETKSQNGELLQCPARIDEELENAIKKMAKGAFRALGCYDLARVDIRLDRENRPSFIEVNPLPGLSKVSLFPAAAAAAGISFEELIAKIIEAAVARWQKSNPGKGILSNNNISREEANLNERVLGRLAMAVL